MISIFKWTKRLASGLLTAALAVSLIACTGNRPASSGSSNKDRDLSQFTAADGYTVSDEVTDLVNIEMADGKHIVVQLDAEAAPITVKNFQELVGSGFYDGLIFHRVIYGFMVQGGDPNGTGLGGSGKTIKGEFSANGVNNNLTHNRGVISMARSRENNSASSQFFIVHITSPHLDGNYAAFGQVVYGLDVIDQIVTVPVDNNDKPLDDVVMKAVYFVTADKG